MNARHAGRARRLPRQIYEEQSAANHYQGQFFTPEALVDLIIAITMPEELADNALVSDPACGSGRMLIAAIRRNRYATFLGTDADLTCVHMTALNCLVRNANTYVIHGNCLSLETHGGYYVRRSPFGADLCRLTKNRLTGSFACRSPQRRTRPRRLARLRCPHPHHHPFRPSRSRPWRPDASSRTPARALLRTRRVNSTLGSEGFREEPRSGWQPWQATIWRIESRIDLRNTIS